MVNRSTHNAKHYSSQLFRGGSSSSTVISAIIIAVAHAPNQRKKAYSLAEQCLLIICRWLVSWIGTVTVQVVCVGEGRSMPSFYLFFLNIYGFFSWSFILKLSTKRLTSYSETWGLWATCVNHLLDVSLRFSHLQTIQKIAPNLLILR